MATQLPPPPPGFDALSPDDQIDYVQSLWDRIASHPEKIPVPQWHHDVLQGRMAGRDANRAEAKPWDAVRDQLRTRQGRPRKP